MPHFSLFSRKSKRGKTKTQVDALKEDDGGSSGSLRTSPSTASLGSSAGSRPNISGATNGSATGSRAPSVYSLRGNGTSTAPVAAAEFTNGLSKEHVLPASRRVPSSASIVKLQTLTPVPPQEASPLSEGTRAPESSDEAVMAAVVAKPASNGQAVGSATVLSTVPQEKGNTLETASDSDSDADETFEVPDEFSDSELAEMAPRSSSPLPMRSASPDRTHKVETKQAATVEALIADPSYSTHNRISPEERAIPVPTETPLRADLRQIWYAISLFLNSQMVASEKILATRSSTSMYYALGYAMTTSMKAMMTFEPAELAVAIENSKMCLQLADTERNKWSTGKGRSWSERLTGGVGGVVRGSSLTVDLVQRMSTEQRHAELAYAEALLLKAIVGLLYSGDFVAFIREALNMRTSSAVYRVLGKFLKGADNAHPEGYDPTLDLDFRSGVEFGNASTSLILSLLPSSAIKIMEIFGFSGNREEALASLMKTGGWTKSGRSPNISEGPGNEGIRAPVCDLTLLMYHLIISTVIPVSDVDIGLADRILHYNLARYPQGAFWLYFSGRLYSTQAMAKKAIIQYNKGIQSQKEYRQIQHICNWDLYITYMSLGDYALACENISILAEESNWSKAMYAYAKAVAIYELASGPSTAEKLDSAKRKEIEEIMLTIPGYTKKIGGKSMPIEKFVVRKSRKYLDQDGRLCLPGLELAYVLNSLTLAPRYALLDNHVKQVDAALVELRSRHQIGQESTPPAGWWDDYCLANFLRGYLIHLIALPEQHIVLDPPECPVSKEELIQQAVTAFKIVLDNTLRLELDHHVAYFAHYEYARLLVKMGKDNDAEARTHLAAVLEGKVPLGPSKGKGKVSLQNMMVLRANAAMDQLKTSP